MDLPPPPPRDPAYPFEGVDRPDSVAHSPLSPGSRATARRNSAEPPKQLACSNCRKKKIKVGICSHH